MNGTGKAMSLSVMIIFAALGAVQGQAALSPDVFLQISTITEAGPPRVYDEMVVFTWEGLGFTRYVAAAFAHEGFQHLHRFVVRPRDGREDLFYLVYPIRPGMDQLEYRLIVDGVWMDDPLAPVTRRDRHGVSLSQVPLRETPVYRLPSPVAHGDGTATFLFALDLRVAGTLETVDQRQISVERFTRPRIHIVGTFNGWDPFMHRLQPSPGRPGFWEVTMPVSPGDHFYFFLIDGERVLDPINLSRARDRQTDGIVSTFQMPQRAPQR